VVNVSAAAADAGAPADTTMPTAARSADEATRAASRVRVVLMLIANRDAWIMVTPAVG
jgi:hypothetical protein